VEGVEVTPSLPAAAATLSPLASDFSLRGQRKVTKRKALSAQEHSWPRWGLSRIFGLAIHGSTENGARPARRPPGLGTQGNSGIVSGKSDENNPAAIAYRCRMQRNVLVALAVDSGDAHRTALTDNP
jgi:hypothetical protein